MQISYNISSFADLYQCQVMTFNINVNESSNLASVFKLRFSCLYGDIINQIVESWHIAISRFVTKTNRKLCEMENVNIGRLLLPNRDF